MQTAETAASAPVAQKVAPQRQVAQQRTAPPLANTEGAAGLQSSARGTTGYAQDGTAKEGPVTPFLQRLKAELPPAAHKAVTAHLAAYK
jgi:hypothetical protein